MTPSDCIQRKSARPACTESAAVNHLTSHTSPHQSQTEQAGFHMRTQHVLTIAIKIVPADAEVVFVRAVTFCARCAAGDYPDAGEREFTGRILVQHDACCTRIFVHKQDVALAISVEVSQVNLRRWSAQVLAKSGTVQTSYRVRLAS